MAYTDKMVTAGGQQVANSEHVKEAIEKKTTTTKNISLTFALSEFYISILRENGSFSKRKFVI